MFFVLGISILLALFLILSGAGTMVSIAIWGMVRDRIRHWPGTSRARFLFLLRVLPLGLAFSCVVLVIAPAFLLNEPRVGVEAVSLKLALLALLSGLGIAAVILRGVASWLATIRLSRDWRSKGRRISIRGTHLPTFRMEHEFPVLAVIGTFRPQLFVANQVAEVLNAEEMSAALAHENGHLIAQDNLKRALLQACQGLLVIIPWGRSLDRAWARASEEAADEFAASVRADLALELASAVVKLARIIPPGARPTIEAEATFLVGANQKQTIAARVRKLLALAASEPQPTSSRASQVLAYVLLTLAISFFGISLKFPEILATIHGWTEHLVAFLQ